jgi:USP8 dimerisation domain
MRAKRCAVAVPAQRLLKRHRTWLCCAAALASQGDREISPPASVKQRERELEMGARGPTRERLQEQCVLPDSLHSTRLEPLLNVCRQLLTQGDAYNSQSDAASDAAAYVYYKRFLSLVLNQLPQHSSWGAAKFAVDRGRLQREAKRVLPLLEALANRLDAADEAEAQLAAAAAAMQHAVPSAPEACDESFDDSSGVEPVPLPRGAAVTTPSAPPGASDTGRRNSMSLQDAMRSLSLSNNLTDSSSSSSHQCGCSYPRFEAASAYTPATRAAANSHHTGSAVSTGLRKMALPLSLVTQFEALARPNTVKGPHGVETCGILAGKLVGNVLTMSTLILPPQVLGNL